MSVAARVMPRLDAFDEEFGREEADTVEEPRATTGFRIPTLIVLALLAGGISALALGWPNTAGPVRGDSASEEAAGENPGLVIRRLKREVDTLKKEVTELTLAQRQA